MAFCVGANNGVGSDAERTWQAWQGEARPGEARSGRRGKVSSGLVRSGKVRLARFAGFRNGCEWSGEFGIGSFRLACCGCVSFVVNGYGWLGMFGIGRSS